MKFLSPKLQLVIGGKVWHDIPKEESAPKWWRLNFLSVCVCLFVVCLFVCLFVCCSFVRLFVCSFVRLFVCSFVRLFVCSFVRLFVCSFVCLSVCLFCPDCIKEMEKYKPHLELR